MMHDWSCAWVSTITIFIIGPGRNLPQKRPVFAGSPSIKYKKRMSIALKFPRDLTQIDVNNLGELIWWSNHLGINPERVLSIVDKVGNRAKDVRNYHWRHNGSNITLEINGSQIASNTKKRT
jgi:hypothetical protein